MYRFNNLSSTVIRTIILIILLMANYAVAMAQGGETRRPIKIRITEIGIANDMDCYSCGQGVGDIHVQLKFKSFYGGGSGIDGIDYSEWQIGDYRSIFPQKVLTVYAPLYDDLVIGLYDDDLGSSGRGSGDVNGSDDIIENVQITDFAANCRFYTLNGNTADGGYIQIDVTDDTVNQPNYSNYPWVRYSPHIVQPEVDRNGNNNVLAIIYDLPVNNTITYYIVYQDEDHPSIDGTYDAERRQQWTRLEDVEWVKVHYDAAGVDWVQIKYGGGQSYFVSLPNDNDIRTFYRSKNEIQFNGAHPKIFVATWNHLHDVKQRADLGGVWKGVDNLLLIDGAGIDKDRLLVTVK